MSRGVESLAETASLFDPLGKPRGIVTCGIDRGNYMLIEVDGIVDFKPSVNFDPSREADHLIQTRISNNGHSPE